MTYSVWNTVDGELTEVATVSFEGGELSADTDNDAVQEAVEGANGEIYWDTAKPDGDHPVTAPVAEGATDPTEEQAIDQLRMELHQQGFGFSDGEPEDE